ncbi:MAG: T9SS type A sorting domain-containing protein [Bacteroidia bacterium]
MKHVFSALIGLLIFQLAMAQDSEEKDIMVDGKERYYTMVTPSDYSADNEYPLVISLHGYYQYISSYRAMIGLDSIAEKEKFIVAYPMGGIVELVTNPMPNCLFPEGLGWDANGYFKQKHGHNDEKFILELMDQLEKDYNINKSRIYLMGASNGGFMASKIAAKHPEKFAAVSCWRLIDSAQATATVPMMITQGDQDPIGNLKGWSLGFTKWNDIKHDWLNVNGCDTNATLVELEDLDTTDGSTVTLYKYNGTETNQEVWIYMENGGGHLMPHSPLIERCPDLGEGNRDYKTGEVTWNFFKRHQLTTTSISQIELKHNIYPNPANQVFTITINDLEVARLTIVDINGKEVVNSMLSKGTNMIETSHLNNGVYLYQIQNANGVASGKLLIKR